MLLFSSTPPNTGKKYIKNKDQIDSVFAGRAEDFNKWFSENYTRLYRYLADKQYLEYDVFVDTFEKVYSNVLYSGAEISNYRTYFLTAYFSMLQTDRVFQNRFCELLDNVDIEDREYSEIVDIDEKRTNLEQDIFKYVYSKYSLRNFELFKMYMHLKPAVNYSTLESITGVKAYLIQRIVSKIKKDIQQNKEFQKRRKEVL